MEMEQRPDISVVIVTYRSLDFIDHCLKPLVDADRTRIEVIVVDNQSPDGTADHIEAAYPWVRLLRAPTNGGFASGNNLGFRRASAPVVMLLNPDAFVAGAGQVLAMADWLTAHADVAAVGPRLVNADGSHQVGDAGWRIGLRTLLAHTLFLQRFLPNVPSLYLTSPSAVTKPLVDVDWVCGACTLVRKEVIDRVGGLNESIFMYGEDVEWGTRMRAAGWRVVYLPQFVVMHLQGATQKGETAAFYSTKWIDSTLTALAKNHGSCKVSLAQGIFALGFLARAVFYRVDGVLRGRATSRTKSDHMWRYLRHILSGGHEAR